MTIPPHAISGVLPPFVADPARGARAPYFTTMVDVARRFGTSAQRRTIVRGLIRYRAELRRVGVARAFQWLDGSMCEVMTREPNDLDLVTFASVAPPLLALTAADRQLFQSRDAKAHFFCDAYFVQASGVSPAKLAERVAYWYGLFGHRRVTYEWKGFVQVDLDDALQDRDAAQELDDLDGQAAGP